MTFILDMASGKEDRDEGAHLPNRLGAKTPQQVTAADHGDRELQLATVAVTAAAPRSLSPLAKQSVAPLLQSIED